MLNKVTSWYSNNSLLAQSNLINVDSHEQDHRSQVNQTQPGVANSLTPEKIAPSYSLPIIQQAENS